MSWNETQSCYITLNLFYFYIWELPQVWKKREHEHQPIWNMISSTKPIFVHINWMSGVKYTEPKHYYKNRRKYVAYSVSIDHYHSLAIINSPLIANVWSRFVNDIKTKMSTQYTVHSRLKLPKIKWINPIMFCFVAQNIFGWWI